MGTENISGGNWTTAFHEYQAELISKMKKGETEEEIPIGAGSYTQTHWNKMMENLDASIENIKEEQKQRLEKEKEHDQAKKVMEAAANRSGSPVNDILKSTEPYPYSNLAKNGSIDYNGVHFVCDPDTNSICLGDVTDKENTIVVALENGGFLRVNRDSLDGIQKAIGMFSPGDVARILIAIAKDNRIRSIKQELDEKRNQVPEPAKESEI